jgi:hypothetical protein
LSEIVASLLAFAAKPAIPAFRDEEIVMFSSLSAAHPVGFPKEFKPIALTTS